MSLSRRALLEFFLVPTQTEEISEQVVPVGVFTERRSDSSCQSVTFTFFEDKHLHSSPWWRALYWKSFHFFACLMRTFRCQCRLRLTFETKQLWGVWRLRYDAQMRFFFTLDWLSDIIWGVSQRKVFARSRCDLEKRRARSAHLFLETVKAER